MTARRAFVLGALATGSLAHAAPSRRVVLAGVQVGDQVPARITMAVRHNIEQPLAGAGFTVVEPEVVSAELTACRVGTCVRDVARAANADAVIVASLAMVGETPIIDLVLFDAASAQVIAMVHDVCEMCGEAAFEERLRRSASALRAQVSEPAVPAVRAPVPAPRPSAPIPARAPVPRSAPGPERSLLPGIAIGVGGLLAIGVGAYLWSINGRGTCHAGEQPVYPDPDAQIRYLDGGDSGPYVCLNIYRTKSLGIATLGAGVLATALGATLFFRAFGHRDAIELTPTPGGANVSLVTRW